MAAELHALPEVHQVLIRQDSLLIAARETERTLARAYACFTAAGATVSRIEIRRPNLETLFMKITGRSLRD